MMQQNHYTLLDVPSTATRKEITAAYRKQMRLWHPDQFRGTDHVLAENYSKQLNNAYSVLSDPKKRSDYDQSLRLEVLQQQIMERYVAGSSGWNLDGAPAAHAPRRPMTPHEKREQRQTDRNASRSVVVTFGIFALSAIVLLLLLSVVSSVAGAFF